MDIKGYEGLYKIEENGAVFSLYRNKKLKEMTDRSGYLFVNLSKNGKYKSKKIHRLLAEHYIDNPNKYPQVDHRDGNKKNNCLKNLRWCTISMNNINKKKKEGTTGDFIGVHWAKPNKKWNVGKWRATVRTDDGISKIVGSFDSQEDAFEARCKWIKENIPEEKHEFFIDVKI